MQKLRKNDAFSVQSMARLAAVAAAYVVLTVMIQPLSYGAVQFRFSEILVLLCFYRKDYSAAMILGCFIANLFSPFGLYDIIFGTLATAAAVLPMYYMPNIYPAALLPVIANGVIVGFELYLCGEPLWFSMGTVALGEFAVVSVVGVIIFKLVLERRAFFMKLIGCTKA